MNAAHVGVVWNPSKTSREDLEAAFSAAENVRVSWYETTAQDPGQGAARAACEAGVDLVLAAGGDGTVRAVAEFLAEATNAPDLGIVPLGTGNLLARNLDVPLNDISAAVQRALSGTGRPLDIGWVDSTHPDDPQRHAFAVMAGFGLDAHMISETDDDLKKQAGWLAYVESLGRAFAASTVIDMQVSRDGGELIAESAHTLIVGNCGMIQAGVTVLPDADPRDGVLDLLLLRADGIAGWMDTMRNMVWDNGVMRFLSRADNPTAAVSSDSATHQRFDSLTVKLAEPRIFEVDGDEIGEITGATVTVQKGALRVR